MDNRTDLLELDNTSSTLQSELFGDFDDLIDFGDSTLDLARDQDAFFDLQAFPHANLELQFTDQTWDDLVFDNPVQFGLDDAFDCSNVVSLQADFDNDLFIGLPDVNTSSNRTSLFDIPAQYSGAEDLVLLGEDAASSSSHGRRASAIKPWSASFINGTPCLDPDPPRHSLTSQSVENPPQTPKSAALQHTNDELSKRFKRRRQSQEPAERSCEVKAARTKISSSAKQLMMQHFQVDPYLRTQTITQLSAETGLSAKTMRTWYANARSRTERPLDESHIDGHAPVATQLPQQLKPFSAQDSASKSISAGDLEAINRASPAPSTASMEKYLSIPICEEAVSIAAVQAAMPTLINLLPPPSDQFMPFENAGSDSSFGSAGSYRSVDLRGARQGRMSWTSSALTPQMERQSRIDRLMELERVDAFFDKAQVKGSDNDQGSRNGPKAYFCTWPDCYQSFRNKYEWSRHEEPKHYCPYHWVCCLNNDVTTSHIQCACFICGGTSPLGLEHITQHEEFEACKGKDISLRTFLREDHLAQHIQNRHSGDRVPGKSALKPLLVAWKTDNADLPREALFCGFCSTRFGTWGLRKEHVFNHFGQPGICKEVWRTV